MTVSIDVLTEIAKMLGGNPATVQRIEIGPREVEITELVVDDEGKMVIRGDSVVRQTYTISVSHEREGGPGVPVPEATEMSDPRQPGDVDLGDDGGPCAEYNGPAYFSSFCLTCHYPKMDHTAPDAKAPEPCSFPGCDRPAIEGEDGCGLAHVQVCGHCGARIDWHENEDGGAWYHRVPGESPCAFASPAVEP